MQNLPRPTAGSLPRALGWATVAYSAAIIVRPRLLAAPCGFVTPGGQVPRPVATLIAAIGARDLASGLAMAFAPAGPPLQTAIAVRVAADLSDALAFGVGIPEAGRSWRIAGIAAGWGALCAASARIGAAEQSHPIVDALPARNGHRSPRFTQWSGWANR